MQCFHFKGCKFIHLGCITCSETACCSVPVLWTWVHIQVPTNVCMLCTKNKKTTVLPHQLVCMYLRDNRFHVIHNTEWALGWVHKAAGVGDKENNLMCSKQKCARHSFYLIICKQKWAFLPLGVLDTTKMAEIIGSVCLCSHCLTNREYYDKNKQHQTWSPLK